MGLAFGELSLLSLDDYTTFVEAWAGTDDDSGGYRRATQADINRILG